MCCAMRQFKAVAARWIGRQDALKHTALHVEEVMQLLAGIFFPCLEDLFFKLVQIKVSDARQAAVE